MGAFPGDILGKRWFNQRDYFLRAWLNIQKKFIEKTLFINITYLNDNKE